jgi:hypothetical protein
MSARTLLASALLPLAACASHAEPASRVEVAAAPPASSSPKIARPAPARPPASDATSSPQPAKHARAGRPRAEMIDLAIDGMGEAVAWVPSSNRARPIVVAAHGDRDRPEWQCWIWRRIVQDRAFVLCPRGVPRADDATRFTFASDAALSAEIEAGVAALVAEYGDRVDPSARVYSGHSLGAIYGSSVVARASSRWSRAVFSEGGKSSWTIERARAFAADGGRRVLFACGQIGCLAQARAAVARDAKFLPSRVAWGEGGGHHFFGPVSEAIGDAFGWLVEGDEGVDPEP